jgi:hypothetical protein
MAFPLRFRGLSPRFYNSDEPGRVTMWPRSPQAAKQTEGQAGNL